MGKKGKGQGKKLTKEEKEQVAVKRAARAEARKQGQEKRQQGRTMVAQSQSWTGKLPGSLLHEHCQKQKWNRVEYEMRKQKEGFVATAVLSWKNPKTSEVIKVKMHAPAALTRPQETALEARHYVATYALHRIAFAKNIHMVLPTNHKNYWRDLEDARKELVKQNPAKAQLEYNADPFAAILEKRKVDEQRDKERRARDAERERQQKPTIVIGNGSSSAKRNDRVASRRDSKELGLSAVRFPRKAWENAVMIDLEPRTRVLIDDVIRKHSDFDDTEAVTEGTASASYSGVLETIGFRKTHVDEAVLYTTNFDDCLEWLIFHVPEDDLPPVFAKNEDDSRVRLRISKDPSKEHKIDTLCEGSCSRNEASTTLATNDYDIVLAAGALTNRLIDFKEAEMEEEGAEDPETMWIEERDSLQAIFLDRVKQDSSIKEMYEVLLEPEGLVQPKGKHLLALRAFRSKNYPRDICGLQVVVKDQSYRLPKYINQSILTQLLTYIAESGFVGMPYIYSCVDWLEANIHQVLENPGPLYKPTKTVSGSSVFSRGTSTTVSANSSKRHRSRGKRSDKLLQSMREEYEKRQGSTDLKLSVRRRSKLPAWKEQEALVKLIQSNRACIVTGETGSGKSTQIVQFVLDQLCQSGDFATNIICTQPRRISALGLADRVAAERTTKCGAEVGYAIRGDNKTDKTTRISFVTTGVLLRMIQSLYGSTDSGDKSFFDDVGYIFVDEVHERSIDSDFLLIILKKMVHRFPKLHVVLMSATIDLKMFSSFFQKSSHSTKEVNIPHHHISGRTFPIEDFYLDTVLEDLDFKITTSRDEILRPKADSKYFQEGNINYDLIAKLVAYVDRQLTAKGSDGSILIFLPGVMEISKCLDQIDRLSSGGSFWGLPLHSGVSSHDQRRVFQSAPHGKRKIVASTNVAETSVTIPDAVAVIDTGRVKSVHYDVKTDTTRLMEGWSSRAEIAQRRGRAGRVREGLCYRLFTNDTEQNTMLSQPIPEIKRTPLAGVYLVVKAMGVSDVFKFLQEGLDPPSMANVQNARQTLVEVGALRNDKLTALGRYLSMLPTDMKSGKLLLYSTLFGCVENGLTLASISVAGNPFIRAREVRDRVKVVQNRFSHGKGDLMAILNAYNEYSSLKGAAKQRNFLEDNYLSRNTIRDIQSTRAQYLSDLQDLGFLPMGYARHKEDFPEFNRHASDTSIITSIATAALFPHIARVQPPDPKFLASGMGAVGVDPDSRRIKYWIRNEEYIKERIEGRDPAQKNLLPATRAFLHPSSTFFSFSGHSEEVTEKDIKMDAEGNYIYAPSTGNDPSSSSSTLSSSFIAYDSSQTTSKLYLHGVTPASILAILLFGGQISYDLSSVQSGRPSPGIVMDGWLPIRTWCKNAVMMTRLRSLLDSFLDQTLVTPRYGDKSQPTQEESAVLRTIESVLAIENR